MKYTKPPEVVHFRLGDFPITLTKAHIVETLFELIKQSLQDGDDVLISGFGKFSVKEKHQRRGRNPQTGESITLPPRRVVTFKWSSMLKEKINQPE